MPKQPSDIGERQEIAGKTERLVHRGARFLLSSSEKVERFALAKQRCAISRAVFEAGVNPCTRGCLEMMV